MRKLIAWNIASLDGYFEGEQPWDLSMHELIWGPELDELSDQQLWETDTLVFGRKTYEGMAAYWSGETGNEPGRIADRMNAIAKIVVSNSLKTADWNNTRVLGGDLEPVIQKLKSEPGKAIFVFGSAELLDCLLRLKLVDEYRLGIAPTLLGKGNPLFKPDAARATLKLLECRPVNKNGVLLRYEIAYLPPVGG